MTGSNPLNGSTSGRHPNLLQQQGCRHHDLGDQLRRRAIRNSYECRSLCGTASTQANYMATDVHAETPENRKLFPPLSSCKKQPPTKQSKRSNRFGSVVLTRPKSSPRGVAGDRKKSIKRSSSYSSVAITHTGPTLRNNSSSYVCHTTAAVRAQAKGTTSYAHKTMPSNLRQKTNNNDASDLDSALKQSSSYSEIHPNSSAPPPCSTTVVDYSSVTGHALSIHNRVNSHPAGQSPYYRHNDKAFTVHRPERQIGSKYPQRAFKQVEHTNHAPCGQMTHAGRREHPDVKYSSDSKSSIYHNSYQCPQVHSEYDSCMPTTRYGSSPAYYPAKGIVPTAMSPRIPKLPSSSSMSTKNVDKRITLHPPRGKKVASLV